MRASVAITCFHGVAKTPVWAPKAVRAQLRYESSLGNIRRGISSLSVRDTDSRSVFFSRELREVPNHKEL